MSRHSRTVARTSSIRLLCLSLCCALVFTTGQIAPRAASPVERYSRTTARVRWTRRAAGTQQAAPPWRDGELLVRFRPEATEQAINSLLASRGLQRGKQLRGGSRVERLALVSGQEPRTLTALLGQSPLVEFAEPNAFIKADQAAPNDPRFPEQWALFNPSVPGGDIGVTRAWPSVRGSRGTVVAVIDSGIDFSHPDLRRNQWINVKEMSTTEDADGDGYAGDRRGWDFVTNSPAITDGSGHGTAVAGIIAAEGNNGAGVTGVMWRAGLMSLRVLDSASTGDVASVVEAMDYAVAHGAGVVNCSWGTSLPSAALRDAIERAGRSGVLVVASAGNDSQDIDSAPHYPASFDLPNIVSVAASDSTDNLASSSGWGATHVTLAAPGVQILSTKAGGDYEFVSGTSAAAALVTGVAGLFKTLARQLTGAQLKSSLTSGVRQVPGLAGKVASGGVVNAPLTLEAAGRLLEESSGGGNSNAGNGGGGNGGAGGGIGNGNAAKNSVRPSPPSLTPATPNLPNLDDVRARRHEAPRVPDPITSDRLVQGGPRASHTLPVVPQGGLAPTNLLARLEGYSLTNLAATLRLSLNLPATDYYGAYGTSDSAPVSGPTAAPASAAGGARSPRLGTEVSHAPTLARLFAFQAPPAYGASFAGQTVPATMVAGRPYQVSVTMTNTGSNTWTATDLYRLGEIDNGPWGGRAHLTQAVSYGASVTFNFTVVAPSAPGSYPFQWQMVREGVTWFGAPTNSVTVTVNSPVSGGAPTSGLVGYWRFDEASGTTASDSSGAGNAGTLTNGPAWAAGAVGGALSFDGADDYVGVGARPSLAMSGALTISAWVRPAGDGVIVNKEGEYEVAVMGGHVQWAFNNTNPGWAWVDTGVVPPQGQWTHVAVTYENGVVKTYASGALAHTYAGAGSLPAGSNEFRIGGRVCCPQFFAGQLDEVRVYNRALTASEVGTLPNAVGGGAPPLPLLSLDPLNRVGEPGEDLLSRNFNWSIPLVGLKGRSGLDLGLSLSYNSLVWRRDGSSMIFDEDRGDPTPGFRLGFPVVRGPFTDANVGLQAYLLVLPSGRRVELQQLAGTNAYESIDSSYLRLTDAGNGLLYLLTPDGTQMQYYPYNGLFRCTQILDRNGNYISISYNVAGSVSTVIDTLGRAVAFQYDGNNRPLSITQTWRREQLAGGANQVVQETHTWATFGYGAVTLGTNYPGLALSGAQNGQAVAVLTQVGLPDGTRYNFDYNSYAQVYRVTRSNSDVTGFWAAPSYVQYNLPLDGSAAQSDCPRFTERRDWAAYWNGDSDGVPATNEEVVTSFSAWDPAGAEDDVTTPDGTTYKEFYATSGWQRGLTTSAEFWSGGLRRKWTTTSWTQDSGSINYQRNPAPSQMDVDDGVNHRSTGINYTYYGLPDELYESGPSGVIRRTHTDYNLSSAYTDKRILGLVSGRQLYEGFMGALQSKVEYSYDEGGATLAQQGSPVQHDNVNFGLGLVQGRGLLTRARRYDVTNLSQYTDTVTGYNTTGSVVFTRDPLNHQTTISYADAFFNPNDPNTTADYNTYAYPTTITDADNYSSAIQYYYDLGAVRRARDQKNAWVRTYYDQTGRIERTASEVSGGYTRFVYATNGAYVQSYSLVDAGVESYSIRVFNGLGTVRAAAANHPNSAGGYSAQYTSYDVMGRVSSRSNPHEITGNWTPAGDDAAGYQSVTQTFDWKGRPFVTTNTADGTIRQLTYGGCGCAGGEVVTARDEAGRQQRTTADALGRVYKTEVLNMDGTVYSTTTTTFSVRDQVTHVFVQEGTAGAGQETLTTYDGYGRVQTSKEPMESAPTSYSYNPDDTVLSVTDARGAARTYTYNGRHLATGVTYGAPSGVQATPAVSFAYDAAGNRTQMSDGTGTHTYAYDALSRLTSESQQFAGLAGTFSLTYGYGTAGQLTSVADSFGARVSYTYDSAGRLTDVGGSGFGPVTQFATGARYRAWGAVKSMAYGNGVQLAAQYDSRLRESRRVFNNLALNGQSSVTFGSETQYYADGRVRYARDLQDGNFDRAYDYDHAGRLKEAYSGREARGLQPTWPDDNPFRQSYSYDVWGEMSRTSRLWSAAAVTDAPAYTDGRRADWTYDAAGNVTASRYGQQTHSYDAAGEAVHYFEDTWTGSAIVQYTIDQTYDAAGQVGSRVETRYTDDGMTPLTQVTGTYYLRSTVLGGAALAEIDAGGQKRKGCVYAGGGKLAEWDAEAGGALTWRMQDPSRGSWVEAGGLRLAGRKELDPLGAEVGTSDPYVTYGTPSYSDLVGSESLYTERGNPLDAAGGCALDGFAISCSDAAEMINLGEAEPDGRYYVGDKYHGFQYVPPFNLLLSFVHYNIPGENVGGFTAFYNGDTQRQGQKQQPQNTDRGPETKEIKKDFYDKYGQAFNDCLHEVFKGDVTEPQTLENAPILNTEEVSSTLRRRAGIPPDVHGRVVGTIDKPKKGNGGAIMIDSDMAETYGLQNLGNDREVLLTYGHELANLLDVRTNPSGKNHKKPGFVYGDETGMDRDKDTGQAMENCMKRKLGI